MSDLRPMVYQGCGVCGPAEMTKTVLNAIDKTVIALYTLEASIKAGASERAIRGALVDIARAVRGLERLARKLETQMLGSE